MAVAQGKLTQVEECNKNTVCDFYKALASRDTTTVQRLLAPDIEWWFHGPPAYNHLMGLLTGNTAPTIEAGSFNFEPLSVVGIGSMVVAEGYDIQGSKKISWVHAWTVEDGVITQVREYFNTSVTVTRFKKPSSIQITSPRSPKTLKSPNYQSVWQSELTDNSSMPGLLLAL